MMPQQLVKDWMRHAELPEDLFLPELDGCAFSLGGGMDVLVEAPPGAEDVFVSIIVARAAVGDELAAQLHACMVLNAYALETRGGVLGLDAARGTIVFAYRANAELLDAALLDGIVNNLMDVAAGLSRKLKDEAERPVRFAAAEPLSSDDVMIMR